MRMRRTFAICCVWALLLAGCGDKKTSATSITAGGEASVTTGVPVATPEQQQDIDLVVKGWDLCLAKLGDDPATGQAITRDGQRLVTFGGKAPVTLAITSASDGQTVVKAADAATQKLFDKAGTDCQYK